MEKQIFTIGYTIPTFDKNKIDFYEQLSLMDADILLIAPDSLNPRGHWVEFSSSDSGCYDVAASKEYIEKMAHLKKEIQDHLSSGKNVFVEKPPTTDSDQLVKLIELAKKQNLSLFTNNTFLYDPFYKKIINAIKDKKINYLNLIWLKYGSFKEDITWNLGYHYLAIILSLINQEPKIVNTEIQENRFFLDLEFASKLRCNVFIDRKYSAKATRLININYKNKQILWTKDNLFCVDNGEVNKTSSEGNISPLESIVTDFTKDLNQNSKDYRNIELSLKVVNLIEKIHNFQ